MDYSFDGYTSTSVTAWRNWYNLQQRDGDFHATAANYVDSNDIQLHDRGSLAFNQTTEELRLASPTDQFIDYVVGAFYYHTDEKDTFTRSDFQCTASTLAIDGTGFRPCSSAAGVSTFLTTAGTANFDTRFNNELLFGQATMHISDRFRLIGGLRYIHDEVNYSLAAVRPTNHRPRHWWSVQHRRRNPSQ